MLATHQRLYVNIDHIATVRQARRGDEPNPVDAIAICEASGADGITAHLREDRRHIQDEDITALKTAIRSYFNLEIACTEEMINLAVSLKPEQVTLVPERREEITTEGGLNVAANSENIRSALVRLSDAGIRTSLFIAPDKESVDWSKKVGADSIELHTGPYAHDTQNPETIAALRYSAQYAADIGLYVHAGHGLTTRNLAPVAAIPEIEELNIGHSIISRSIFVGLSEAVREIRQEMDQARLILG